MRHERISQATAAAWPSTLESLVLAEPPAAQAEVLSVEPVEQRPTPAAPDVAAGVGGLIVAAYAALILVFFTFFAGSLTAMFAITICAGFVAIFFTVPRIFFAVEPEAGRHPSLSRFMYDGIDTLTGRSSGRDALVQMLIVPVLLALGLIAMGITGAIYL